jgi:two-component system nitrogen regulation response regulator GlnG
LRDRQQDIPDLMRYFLNLAAMELTTEVKRLMPKSEAYLSSLYWPGNVRQLENICRWLTVMASGRDIHLEDLPPELSRTKKEQASESSNSWKTLLEGEIRQKLIQGSADIAKTIIPEIEAILIRSALQHTSGKRNEAALLLGYGRNTLTRKVKELGIE